MTILKKFNDLLFHLNAEENGLALEFQEALEEYVTEAEEDSLWLSCLEDAGVDNWSGYDHALDALHEARVELSQ